MAFDLASVLKEVPDSGTGREQIEYLRLDQLLSDANNFYQLSKVEELAANIQLCGLQQPIRVRKCSDKPNSYTIVSGHRRRAAIELLASEEPERWTEIPCIVEQDEASPALQQLRLIYANANTRTMTPAEISEQAVQVEKLLYQLKEEGYDFPGRMRDHVAQAVGASKSKLSRLKVIRENLEKCWRKSFEANELAESTAYALAQMPGFWQQLIFDACGDTPRQVYEGSVREYMQRFGKISKNKCQHQPQGDCTNKVAMMQRSCRDRWQNPCIAGCCMNCISLKSCKSSCPSADAKKKELRDSDKAKKQAEAMAKASKEAPTIEFIKGIYKRVGIARELRGVSVQKLFEAQKRMYSAVIDDPAQKRLESGLAKYSVDTDLPFGYGFYAGNAQKLCSVADALGCSIDYLLGRSEDLRSAGGWQTGKPWNLGEYAVVVRWANGCKKSVERMEWDGEHWRQFGKDIEIFPDTNIFGWIELPEED